MRLPTAPTITHRPTLAKAVAELANTDNDVSVIERTVEEQLAGGGESVDETTENAYPRAIGVGIANALKQHGIESDEDLYDMLARNCNMSFIVLDQTPESQKAYMSRLVKRCAEAALGELTAPRTINNRNISAVMTLAEQHAYGFLEETLIDTSE